MHPACGTIKAMLLRRQPQSNAPVRILCGAGLFSFFLIGSLSLPASAATITVNSTADTVANDGVCTLREAVVAANANTPSGAAAGECAAGQPSPTVDTIAFNIPGAGVHTITPASPLPSIDERVIIDGYTQPGAAVNTDPNGFNGTLLIELNGVSAGDASGLVLAAGNSTVRGLVINRFQGASESTGTGILVTSGLNHIQGNFIGSDPTGTSARPNTLQGITIQSGSGNLIGGTSPDARNIVSANTFDGVAFRLFLGDGSGNIVQGNFIGTQANGTGPLGNARFGVLIGPATGSTSNDNTIGGTVSFAGNRIAFNGATGVAIVNVTVGNAVLGNSIFSNGGLGIGLDRDGVTANDPGDGDTGPNNLQNFPVISSTTFSAGNVTISGSLNSTPSTAFRVEFFSNASCNPSGNGEGQTFLGFTNVTTNGGGDASFGPLSFLVPAGQPVITSTATDPNGNTSEFSQCLPTLSINDVTAAEGNSGLTPFVFTVTLSAASASTVTVNFATANGTAPAGSDYQATSGTLTFTPGQTSQTITVNVIGDTTVEPDETFVVNLSGATNATIAGAQGTGTITNDDIAPPGNQAPVASAGPDQTVPEGTLVTLDGSGSVDPDGGPQPLSFAWVQLSGQVLPLAGGDTARPTFMAPSVRDGTAHTLVFRVTVSDGALSATDTVSVVVQPLPASPLGCEPVRPRPGTLWPPNHQLVPVVLMWTAVETPATVTILGVTQDEPTEGTGDGDTAPDAEGIQGNRVDLRAERAGGGNGRFYHLRFRAERGAESCTGQVQVVVPPNLGRTTRSVDDGPRFDSTTGAPLPPP